MVVLFEFHLEGVFKDGHEFGDVDVAVIDGAGGFECINELDRVGLGGGPGGVFKGLDNCCRVSVELGEFSVEVVLELFIGDDL